MASKGPAFRENIHRLFDEAQSTDLAPGIVSLIESRGTHAQIREVPVSKILPNPAQPRLTYDEESLTELAASIREHGVLQPILVRPSGSKFELIAGERRWRASSMAERETIPAIVAEFDDQTALEVSIIENLQREDVSPLEEATMFRKMTETFGYSLRQLAQKVGKDKGYIENRLRLTDAPADVRELVSVRKDTISHAYELMKIGDERKRRRLEKRIVAGELSLAKLRLITGTTGQPENGDSHEERKPRRRARTVAGQVADARAADEALMGAQVEARRGHRRPRRHPSPAGAPRADPRGQPVELREAPDDHEAEDRERDRDHSGRGPSRGGRVAALRRRSSSPRDWRRGSRPASPGPSGRSGAGRRSPSAARRSAPPAIRPCRCRRHDPVPRRRGRPAGSRARRARWPGRTTAIAVPTPIRLAKSMNRSAAQASTWPASWSSTISR